MSLKERSPPKQAHGIRKPNEGESERTERNTQKGRDDGEAPSKERPIVRDGQTDQQLQLQVTSASPKQTNKLSSWSSH